MSTPPVVTSAPDAQPQPAMGAFARVVGAIVSPKATFQDIARRPSWALPFVLLLVLTLIVSVLLAQKADWRGFFERQNSQNSRFDNMPQEQKDKITEAQLNWTPKLTPVFGVVGVTVFLFAALLIYWGAFNLLKGASLNFNTAFGITTHGFVPLLISSVLAIVVLLIKPTGEVDPEHFLASSLSAYLPDPSPKWLESLGNSIELFWIWSLGLLAIGFAATNPRKIKGGSAFAIVFGLWLLWVACKVGWAAI